MGLCNPSTKAQPIPLDPPARVATTLLDGERLRGTIQSYDEVGFDIQTAEGHFTRVTWTQLSPDQVVRVHDKFIERSDAETWYGLGGRLLKRDDGQDSARLALRRAVLAEPGLESKVERVLAGDEVPYQDLPPTESADLPTTGEEHAEEGGPKTIGELQEQFWGKLSPELMASSVAEIKAHMVHVQQVLKTPLQLHEEASDYFLFYSDLPAGEARQWAGLLDEMYERLCEIFDIKKGTNVFRGRALITVFADEADYHRYHALIHQFPGSAGTLGLCWSMGNGHVDVSFFKQENRLNFARILVHETVHGFIHRYNSYPNVPSWINEGLAEFVATEMVEERGFGKSDYADTLEYGKRILAQGKTLGGNSFFYSDHIQPWQYPVAQMLTDFMIRQDRKRYRGFIDAIKTGKPWDQAIVEDYGVRVDRLVDAFGQRLKIRGLQP